MSALQLFDHAGGAYADFEAAALAEGYDEVLVREWTPELELATHTHPFAVKARVVSGEVWLTVGSDTHHLGAGRGFTLTPGEPHAERYGAEGATFWVARRHDGAAAAA